MKKAVVLISGGVDSTTAAYLAKGQGYDIYGLTLDYGQKAFIETKYARKTMKKLKAKEHYVLDLSVLRDIFKSPLTTKELEMKPEFNDQDRDSYYVVPLRNLVFMSIAASYAESINADAIFIGAHKDDMKGFPDCRKEFYESLQETIAIGTAKTQAKVPGIVIPWEDFGKDEIIEAGLTLGVNYANTHSCYLDGKHCGECESCVYRKEAFKKAGHKDPTSYKV